MGMLAAIIGVFGATAVIFAYLIFIWWLDRYEREPLWVVGLVFLWGGLGGTCMGVAFSTLPSSLAVELFGPGTGGLISTIVVAPLAEEFTKALVFVFLLATMQFDNETDGLIYGAATGLGFACIENLLYFAGAETAGSFWFMVVARTLFTALVHCISSAAIGMAIGWARYRTKTFFGALLAVGVGYLIAVLNHGVWNAAASFAHLSETAAVGGAILLVAIALVVIASLVMFGLTQWSLKREHDVIRAHLAEEARAGVLPEAHADIIPYWSKRRKSGWVPPGVSRKEYVEAATMLAFRRHQLEAARGRRAEKYQRDVKEYRAKVRQLLAES